MLDSSPWFVCYHPRPEAKLRLICFPHGGGGPQAFRAWGQLLPEDIELIALSLPGRGSRLAELPIADMRVLIPKVVEGLNDYFDKPFVFFGHSLGSAIAFEVSRYLQKGGYPSALHLFVSALPSPHLPHAEPLIHTLTDEAMLAYIRELGLVPEEALQDEGLVSLMLPPFKADFELLETYQWDKQDPVRIPITALGGLYDDAVPQLQIEPWQQCTTASFALQLFEGGHFYTQSHQDEVTDFIVQCIEETVTTLPLSILRGERGSYPEKCLHELLREQAVKTPDATAVIGHESQLTFRELDEQSDLLSQYLQSQGVRVNTLVGIYMETSVEYVIAFFAALKAGGAYMTVEIAYPEALLQQVLDSAQPVMLLTKERFYPRLVPEWQARAFQMRAGWFESLASESISVPDDLPLPTIDTLAQCVMSSGTTGTPKGIICPHRSAVNSYYWRYDHHPYDAGEREACNVFLVWEVARPILQGYPAYIIPDEIIYDPPRLIDYLSENQIARTLVTPSLLEQILNTPNLDLQSKLSSLRVVYLNGEVVTTALRNRFHELLPDVVLLNDYSTAEAHDTCHLNLADLDPLHSPKYAPIGEPMSNVNVYVLDEAQQPVPLGFRGEIYVGGDSVGFGYLNQPELTAERFVHDSVMDDGSMMFRSGDAGRILPNGQLEIQGRIAFMVKLRGYTVVPGAIETTIVDHPAVNTAVVVTQDNEETGQPEHLVAYVIPETTSDHEAMLDALRSYLKDNLPHYAIPSFIVPLDELPIAANGKLDRKRLPKPDSTMSRARSELHLNAPETQAEKALAEAWQFVLHLDAVDVTDNFFDLGGHSLLAAALCGRIRETLSIDVSVVDLFQSPTLRALAEALGPQLDTSTNQEATAITLSVQKPRPIAANTDVAIIGMSGRFPGAKNLEAFWQNLRDGVCSIRQFTDEELEQAGIPPEIYSDEEYVKFGALLDGIDQFDPDFWGLTKREATVMDPQQRLFLECCWHALESAGYSPQQGGDRTGVFAGAFLPLYLLHYLYGGGLMDPTDAAYDSLTELGNDKDYLATRVSYMLNLQGPSVSVQTSCSTGLVAIAMAAQSLVTGQCDMALAGASSLILPQAGYQYVEGFVHSRDGVCRAFDAEASGTVLGDGVGVVVLKRLEDAREAGDNILAVIKGYAINNDGHQKAGYSAPSVQGQANVVASALAVADVPADTISYVEAHGTGTLVGDPIEVRALNAVFQQDTDRTGFCALGSIKPNIGHSNITAGVAGLMKAVLALQHQQIPPTIHFQTPNPALELEQTAFYVNTQLQDWDAPHGSPRRAGVTSLGIGGTNCHIILEEWPTSVAPKPDAPDDSQSAPQLLVLSAKTPESLEQNRLNLVNYLKANPDADLADVSYTLYVGREAFAHRLAVSAYDAPSAVRALDDVTNRPLSQRTITTQQPYIVFMLPGAGAQYPQMGQSLYNEVPTFRRHFEKCRDMLDPLLGIDIYELLYSSEPGEELKQFHHIQIAMFVIEYSLSRTLQDWGLQLSAIVGHSMSEYVAACLAGVMSLEDALALVVTRSVAMNEIDIDGAMLAVNMSEGEAKRFLDVRKPLSNGDYVGLAVVNSPTSVVLSGHRNAVVDIEQELEQKDILFRRVDAAKIASHSPLMQKAVDDINKKAHAIEMNPPEIPLALNLTGGWQPHNLPLAPHYWGEQILSIVRFEENIRTIFQQNPDVMLEVGPGRSLARMVTEISSESDHAPRILPTMRHPLETDTTDAAFLLQSLGQLWEAGVNLDWPAIQADLQSQARRIPLPTYAFAKERCWPSEDPQRRERLASGLTSTNNRERPTQHPLLGQRTYSAGLSRETVQYEVQLHPKAPVFLSDHCLYGKVILPATAYLEMALVAGKTLGESLSLADVLLEQSLILSDEDEKGQTVQLLLTPEGNHHAFQIFSLSVDENGQPSWTRHASGQLQPTQETAQPVDITTLQSQCTQPIPIEDFYQPWQTEDIAYGPSFRLLSQLWQGESEALGQIKLSEHLVRDLGAYQLHPALLDAALQAAHGMFWSPHEEEADLYMPIGYDRAISFGLTSGQTYWSHARLRSVEGPIRTVDIDLFDADGNLVASIVGAMEQRTERFALLGETKWQDWLYDVVWRASEGAFSEASGGGDHSAGDTAPQVQHWLILADVAGVGRQLASLLREEGHRCTLVWEGEGFEQRATDEFTLRNTPEEFTELFENIPGVQHMVHLWNLDSAQDGLSLESLESVSRQSCGGALHLLQAALSQHHATSDEQQSESQSLPSVWLVTQGAQPVMSDCLGVAQSPLWGMARVIRLEHPDLPCLSVDLDPSREVDVQALFEELTRERDYTEGMLDDQIAFRHQTRYIARFARTVLEPSEPLELRPDGTYLITGGLGGIGLRVAAWMVERGAKRLILVGRSPAKSEAQGVISELEASGAHITVAQADVTQFEPMADLIDAIDPKYPLRGLFHAAGVYDDGTLERQSWDRFAYVFGPRVYGTWHLHQLTKGMPLDFFVLCSSDAAMVGNAGQANYAAANAFLDAFAHYSSAQGLPTLSIGWGSWAGTGIADQEKVAQHTRSQGMDSFSPEDGLQILEAAIQSEKCYFNVTPIDWENFRTGLTPSAFFDDLQSGQKSSPEATSNRPSSLRDQVCKAVAQILGIEVSQIDPQKSFFSLGLDSLTSLSLRNHLQTGLGTRLPATLIFKYPTVDTLVEHLSEELTESD